MVILLQRRCGSDMGCKLVLFYMFVLRSILVDSFLVPENKNEELQKDTQPRDTFIIQSQWPAEQGASQVPQSLVQNDQRYGEFKRQQLERNVAAPANVFGYGQQINNYDNVTPAPTIQSGYYYPQSGNGVTLQQIQQTPQIQNTPSLYNANYNGPLVRWWNGQRVINQPQQSQIYGRPTFDNYAPRYPHYQSAASAVLNPRENYNTYRQGWLLKNQYRQVPGSVEHIPWPVSDDQNPQTPNVSSENNNKPPPFLAIDPPKETSKGDPPQENPGDAGISSPEPTSLKEQDHIAFSQPSVYDHQSKSKRYVTVHMNGTYGKNDKLDDTKVNTFNEAHIKKKEPPNHALTTVEVEYETRSPLEYPYDTGISKIPRDSNEDTNNHYYPAMSQSIKRSLMQDTTENPTNDMAYFKPEYLMPIQSTTENTIDPITYPLSSSQASNDNDNIETNHTLYTNRTTDILERTQYFINKSKKYFNYNQSEYEKSEKKDNNVTDITTARASNNTTVVSTDVIENTTETNDNTTPPTLHNKFLYDYKNYDKSTTTNKSIIKQETSETETDIKEKRFPIFNKLLTKALTHQATRIKRGFQDETPAYFTTESTPNDNGGNAKATPIFGSASSASSETKTDSENEKNQEKACLPNTSEKTQLREDLRIDISELKTVVDKPIVWFRTDEDFWDKVTSGELAYDALSIYNIHCKPQLIERVTNIHHFPNGTESVEYIETIWDSPDAANPREIKSKKEFRDSK